MNGDNRFPGNIWQVVMLAVTLLLLQACAPGEVRPLGGSANGVSVGTPPEVLQQEYILQAGDEIYIQVFNDNDLTMETKVSQSGSINYSYVGSIEVAGLTADELAASITDKLRGAYLKDPSVNVSVLQYRSFFIDGEVRSPGSYAYEPGLTLAKALSIAGGMTDRGSQRKMNLLREVGGEKKNYRVGLSQDILPGDIITIGEGVF